MKVKLARARPPSAFNGGPSTEQLQRRAPSLPALPGGASSPGHPHPRPAPALLVTGTQGLGVWGLWARAPHAHLRAPMGTQSHTWGRRGPSLTEVLHAAAIPTASSSPRSGQPPDTCQPPSGGRADPHAWARADAGGAVTAHHSVSMEGEPGSPGRPGPSAPPDPPGRGGKPLLLPSQRPGPLGPSRGPLGSCRCGCSPLRRAPRGSLCVCPPPPRHPGSVGAWHTAWPREQ